MIPGNKFMPSFSKAVKIEIILNKYLKNKLMLSLKKKRINFNKMKDFDNYEKVLGNDILNTYFTSNSVIKALNLMKRSYLKNTKKENMFKLLKKVKNKKKFFRN
tara:strand:+ start:236 stop:547 length:312 start_codon:yes stop_codon:yes gene_type:complete